jgi:hypothetical protein
MTTMTKLKLLSFFLSVCLIALPTQVVGMQQATFRAQNFTPGAGYTFVGSQAFGANAGSVTFGYSPTAGHQIYLIGQVSGPGGTLVASTASDNATGGSTTYTADLNNNSSDRSFEDFFIIRTCNVKSGVTQITLSNTTASATEVEGVLLEFSGGSTSSCFDQVTSSAATGTSTTFTSASLTPSLTNELSLGLLFTANTSGPFTGTSGYTCVQAGTGAGGNANAGCYKVLSSTSANTVTATQGSSVAWWIYQSLYK